MAWVVGGVYILLSLFMAVILDSFEDKVYHCSKSCKSSERSKCSPVILDSFEDKVY